MITRTYVVKMPGEVPGSPLDILVQDAPGSQDAPAIPAGGGAYYEVLGRPLRLETVVGDPGFVPRLRLGYTLSIVPISTSTIAFTPGVQLSESLASLASTDGGPVIAVPAFADPVEGPAIRLVGTNDTDGLVYLVTLSIVEPRDADRTGMGT